MIMFRYLLFATIIFSCSTVTTATITSANSTTTAYLYAFPLVLMEFTRKSMPIPSNFLSNRHKFPTPKDKNVVEPNLDTLYSIAWLNLSLGDVELQMGNTEGTSGRFYMFPVMDAFTNVVSSPGWRTTGKEAATFIIKRAQSNVTAPNNSTIEVPTDLAWLIARTNVRGVDDLPTVIQQQKTYHLGLAQMQSQTKIPEDNQKANRKIQELVTPPEDVLALSADDFFTQFAELLKSNPPSSADQSLLSQLTQYGLNPGKSLNWDSLPTASKQAWEMGKTQAQQLLLNYSPSFDVNGWQMTKNNTGNYGTDYTYRAIIALRGLGANEPADAIYYQSPYFDGNQSWSFIFKSDQSPPNHAFWSLTAYDTERYLIDNILNRYNVGSESEYLITKPDGSIEIRMQKDAPTSSTVNWLPVPSNGANFTLNLRVYWPTNDVLSGEWKPPYVLPTEH